MVVPGVMVALSLTILAALVYYAAGRRLLRLALDGDPASQAGEVARLVRRRKRAGAAVSGLIIVTLVTGLGASIDVNEPALPVAATAPGLEIRLPDTPGHAWIASVRGRVWCHLADEGLVGLMAEDMGWTTAYLISPHGQVLWYRDIDTTACNVEYWFGGDDEGMLIDFAGPRTRISLHLPYVGDGVWSEPRPLDERPARQVEKLSFKALPLRRSIEVAVVTDDWQIESSATLVMNPVLSVSRYSASVRLGRRQHE